MTGLAGFCKVLAGVPDGKTRTMNDLLTYVIEAHGGMDRWSRFSTLTARLEAGGPFWGLKGWPDLLTDVTLTLDTRREHITISPFPAADQTSALDVGPERFALQAAHDYDTNGMQRRMDYAPVVTGNPPIAHYTDDQQTFDGIVFPTRRKVYRRNADGTADKSVAVITLDLEDIRLS